MAIQGGSAGRHWSSGTAFIMAAIGGAVGLGNIWRFPFVVGSNGGSAFVLAYLVAVIAIALPLLLAEMAVGRVGGMSAPNSIRKLAKETGSSPLWIGLGWLNMATLFLVLSFYSVIAGWTLAYTFKLGLGSLAGLDSAGVGAAFDGMLANPWELLFWGATTMALTMFIVAQGLAGGIERAISILMPAFFVVLLGFVVYSLITAANAGVLERTFTYLFSPDFSKITPDVMLAAIGQAFYSVTVGTGIMLTYAAYLPREVNLARAGTIVVGADTVVAIVSGLAIFPIVFAFDLNPGEGPGLLFVTLSSAFAQMTAGSLVGSVFFGLVFVAALTSCIAILEPMVSRAEETASLGRGGATVLIGLAVFAFSLTTVLSFNVLAEFKPFAGKTLFDSIDYVASNLMLPLGGMLFAIFAGWRLSGDTVREALRLSDGAMFKLWRVSARYLGPLAIAVVLLVNL
jgi:NSS family neurotransmitter:Na+ symporter